GRVSSPNASVQDLPRFTLIPWHVLSIVPALFGVTGSIAPSSAPASKASAPAHGGSVSVPQLQPRPSSSPGALGGISAAAQAPGGIDSLFVLAAASVVLLGGLVLLRRQALGTPWTVSARASSLRASSPPPAGTVATALAAATVSTQTARTLRNGAPVEAPSDIAPASQPDPPAPAPAAAGGSSAAARSEHGIMSSVGPLGAGLVLLCGVALLRRLAGRSNDT
ncbi:MAG: hypothetical protein JO262_08175, partial [Solirubrobacterales bacterium]|nr:hypothetical protein [Solirubrobacterales bacterium]